MKPTEPGCLPIPCVVAQMQRVLGDSAVGVYLHLMHEARGFDVWLERSKSEIAREKGTSRRLVREALDKLTDIGLAVVIEGGNQHAPARIKLLSPDCGDCKVDCLRAPAWHAPFQPKSGAWHETCQSPDGPVEEKAQVTDGACNVPCQSGQTDPLSKDRKSTTHKEQDPRVRAIFDHWNSLPRPEGPKPRAPVHRALTPEHRKAIEKALRTLHAYDDPLMEIQHAITNYLTVLGHPGTRWSYNWTLQDFLSRGLSRFLDEANPMERELGAKPGKPFAAARTSAFEGL